MSEDSVKKVEELLDSLRMRVFAENSKPPADFDITDDIAENDKPLLEAADAILQQMGPIKPPEITTHGS